MGECYPATGRSNAWHAVTPCCGLLASVHWNMQALAVETHFQEAQEKGTCWPD